MAGLDLSAVAEVLEEWIVDDVAIVRDNGPIDDDLDEDTGELTPADAVTVYIGKGLIRLGGESGYQLLLPLGADVDLIGGELVHVTSANGMPADESLETREYRVADLPRATSLGVARVVDVREVGLI